MLAALHKCLAPGRGRHSDASSLDTAVECLCSLRALLAGLLAEPAKALLYPQLLLACVALLNSSVVRVVELAMHLMLQARWAGSARAAGAQARRRVGRTPASAVLRLLVSPCCALLLRCPPRSCWRR